MKDLLQFALQKYRPTNDQQQALTALNHFFDSDKRCFMLKGYAGTGKTFLIKSICEYLYEEKKNPVLMAPTGRAARIIKTKTGFNATTIHKGIYNLHEIDEVITSKNGKEKYKFRYGINHLEANIVNVYIVDEASMISDKYEEDDFFIFGSGRLLKDLIDFIAPTNLGRKDKIIFVGDPAQLPPVKDNISGALSKDYLKKNFDIDSEEYEMTEVVRQERESGILSIATYIRNQLLNPKRNSFMIPSTSSDTMHSEVKDVVDIFLQENPDLSLTKSVIINYSNRSALEFNLQVRNRIFKDKMQLEPRDILLINQNNYNYDVELLNGIMVKVLSVSPVPEIKSNMKSYDANGDDCRITHSFRRVLIEVPTENGVINVNCMILDNFLYSANATLDYASNIALYLDFKIRYPHLRPKTKEFSDTLRADPYFNALRVKYGYAITCHKAQGGEWDTAIVNMDVSLGKLSDSFLRWTYTAITRASRKLYLFNIPKANQFSKFDYKHKLIPVAPGAVPEMIKEILFQMPGNYTELMARYGLQNEDKFKQDKLIELLAVVSQENLQIVSRSFHDYQEIYCFEKDGKKAGLKFWYDGKNRFTKIEIANNLTTDVALGNELKDLFGQPVTIHLVEESPVPASSIEEIDLQTDRFFDAAHKSYEVLYNELSDILSGKDISIVDIEHKQYQEVYHFKRNKEEATIQFYYDGIDRFTHAEPMLTKCNSNELLIELNAIMQELKSR